MPTKPGPRYQVVDRDGIAELAERAIQAHGTVAAASAALGIGAATLSRLRNGAGGERISRSVARALAQVGDVTPFVVGDAARRRLDRYDEWLERSFAGLLSPDGIHRGRGRFRQLERELSARHRSYFTAFLNAAQRQGFEADDRRVQLALWRVVEPLLAGQETDGIERGATELEARRDLAAYLKVALKREEILLRRASDLDRAQRG